MALTDDLRRVPVIGLQPKAIQICGTLISTVIVCNCGHTAPVLIPAVDRAGVCRACQTKYVIASVTFTNTNGQIALTTQVARWAGPVSATPALDLHAAE